MVNKKMNAEKIIPYENIDPDFAIEAAKIIDKLSHGAHAQDNPTFIHMCGIPGAGKSTVADRYYEENLDEKDYVLIDFDRVMAEIEGYKQDREIDPAGAYKKWSPLAASIGYKMLQSMIEGKRNILLDHGASPHAHKDLLTIARDKYGYRLKMIYVACDPDTALARIKLREQATKRHTPASLIYERQKLIDDILPDYKELVDSFESVDNG